MFGNFVITLIAKSINSAGKSLRKIERLRSFANIRFEAYTYIQYIKARLLSNLIYI